MLLFSSDEIMLRTDSMSASTRAEHVQFADLSRVPDITLGGSTGAYVVDYNAARYVYKTGASIRHAVNEYIAFQLYECAGVKVPTSRLVYDGESPVGLLLEYMEGTSPIQILSMRIPNKEKDALRQAVSKQYVFHALFANYDCINAENYIVPNFADGEEEYYDVNDDYANTNVDPIHVSTRDYNNTYVIDLGGALFYRSKGSIKGDSFKPKSVPELDSIAEHSKTSRGALFLHLAKAPVQKHRTVCEAWRSIHPPHLIDCLRSPQIQSLLIAYDMTELVRIMKGRIDAVDQYCKEPLSSTLSKDDLYALSAELAKDIHDYKDKTSLNHIKEKLRGHTEVLSYYVTQRPLLLQAYEKDSALFHELLSYATKEALDTKGILDTTLLDHVIDNEDYDTIAILIVKGATMTVANMNHVDLARVIHDIRRIAPKAYPFGRIHVASFVPFPSSDIIMDREYSALLPQTKLGSTLDAHILAKKPIHGYKAWIHAQELYLKSSPRIQSIVRAYTFRGDKLANSFLRGTLKDPHDMLNAIRGDGLVPFAYQIYDNYDFLVHKGLTMPAKETLMMEDGQTIHDERIHALFVKNFAYFLRLPNLHTLVKDYCKDLLKIIQHAPPAPTDMFVYRGVTNEDYLKPGTYEYVDTSFSSTSVDPYAAASRAFTSPYYNTPMRFCIYEMKLSAGSPCIFLKSVSHFSESEVLLPHNLRYIHSMNITLKYLCDPTEEFTRYTDPTGLERVFVRRVEVRGFSGRSDPKTFAVQTRRKKAPTATAAATAAAAPLPLVNSIHRKTVRNTRKYTKYVHNDTYV